jgi:uncharacterized protein YjiS (DUF1127 family)
MENHSQFLASPQVTVLGVVQQFIQKISTAAAARRARRETEAAADALQQLDPRLLADFGIDRSNKVRPMEQLANLNPAVLAAGVFSPRHNRR